MVPGYGHLKEDPLLYPFCTYSGPKRSLGGLKGLVYRKRNPKKVNQGLPLGPSTV